MRFVAPPKGDATSCTRTVEAPGISVYPLSIPDGGVLRAAVEVPLLIRAKAPHEASAEDALGER